MGFQASTCPYCACGCGLLLEAAEDLLMGAYPVLAHPVSRGSLCIRGWNSTDAWAHPDRLTQPLVKQAESLVPASPGAALAHICSRLKKCRASGGSIHFALAPTMANEDILAARRLADCLHASLFGFDFSGVPAARRAIRSVFGQPYCAGSPDIIDGAGLIWVFGAELAKHPQVSCRVSAAERRGARVVWFDLQSSSPDPDRLQVTVSGTDISLLPLILQQAALAQGHFPAEVPNAPGFPQLAAAHGHSTSLAAGGLDSSLIQRLAADFRASSTAVAIVGEAWLTTGRAVDGTTQLLQALTLLGAAGRVRIIAGEANSWGLCDLLEGREANEGLVESLNREPNSVVFICGDDLMRSVPRPDLVAGALSSVESVFVLDRFRSDTLPFADVVLPSCGFAELDGTVTNAFGSVQRWRKVVEAPGDACAERVWMGRIAHGLALASWPVTPLEWWQTLAGLVSPYDRVSELYGAASSVQFSDGGEAQLAFSLPLAEAAGASACLEKQLPRAASGSHPAMCATGAVSGRDEILQRESRTDRA